MKTLAEVLKQHAGQQTPDLVTITRLSVSGGRLVTLKAYIDSDQGSRLIINLEYYTTAAGNLRRQPASVTVEEFSNLDHKRRAYTNRNVIASGYIESNKAMLTVANTLTDRLTRDDDRSTYLCEFFYK